MSTKKIKKKIKAKKTENTEQDNSVGFYDPKEINALFEEDNVVMSPTLKKVVSPSDNTLKEMIVEYVGNALNPENDEITVEMVVQVMASDFPEFLMAVAEENWVRGYHQALYDSDIGKKILDEQNKEIYDRNVQVAKDFEKAKKNATSKIKI